MAAGFRYADVNGGGACWRRGDTLTRRYTVLADEQADCLRALTVALATLNADPAAVTDVAKLMAS